MSNFVLLALVGLTGVHVCFSKGGGVQIFKSFLGNISKLLSRGMVPISWCDR